MEKEKMEKDIRDLQEANDKQKEENEKMEKDIRLLQEANDKQKEENEKMEKDIRLLQEANDKQKEENEKMEKDIRLLQEANDKQKKENEKMEEERRKTNKEASEEIRKVMAEKRELEKEKENLESSKNNITKEYNNVKDENDQLAEKARNDSTEIERLNNRVNSLLFLEETLEEQIEKSRTFVSTVLIPGKNDFQSVGVIGTLGNDASAVVATRSSDGPGNASDVLFRRRGKTCGTAEIENSWWCVDIGKDYLLFPTHCSLRHGKQEGDSILRGWKLQGSINGKDWKDVSTCQRTSDLNGQPNFTAPIPYVTGTWPVKGKAGAFRYLRILQTSRNSSGKYGIYLSRIEFYGVLVKF